MTKRYSYHAMALGALSMGFSYRDLCELSLGDFLIYSAIMREAYEGGKNKKKEYRNAAQADVERMKRM